ncbi:SDR family NAD(P)-dependent oxidoreductase [Candidatus Pelagibacter ubique]|nr:SDR family NAD(P)-dependent oxidoreductase [Candidatus Pelagibacter ubique]
MYLQKINLKNKYALVTGAGKGLGRACSIALAEAGATIIALSRTQSDLDKLEKEIKKIKGKVIKVNCDVMNYKDLKEKLDKIKIIDILVNNAGTNIPEPFEKIKQESMNYLVDLNLKAAFNVAQLVVKKMLKNKKRGGSGKMPRNMPKWMALAITKIDLFNKWVGNTVCWITIPLIFAMVYEVLARKLFNAPTMWAYDMSRFMYGALFMLGAGYALSKGVHIRADFLYRNFKTKNQGRIDFWLYLIFYFPGLSVFLYMSTGFLQESIMRGEKGMDTAWMPYMWPIKACLFVGIILLIVQGISELFKSYWAATKGKWPGEEK